MILGSSHKTDLFQHFTTAGSRPKYFEKASEGDHLYASDEKSTQTYQVCSFSLTDFFLTYLSLILLVSILIKPAQFMNTFGPILYEVTSCVLFSRRLLDCRKVWKIKQNFEVHTGPTLLHTKCYKITAFFYYYFSPSNLESSQCHLKWLGDCMLSPRYQTRIFHIQAFVVLL